MELPRVKTMEFPKLDIKHQTIIEEDYEWKGSHHSTAVFNSAPTLQEEPKKHKVRWEEKMEPSGENDAVETEQPFVHTPASTPTDKKEDSLSSDAKDSLKVTDSLECGSEAGVDRGNSFPTDISLQLVMVKRKSGLPDPRLQGVLRSRLRLLENDSKEVMAVFGELSARLVSIHSDQDLIIVTFKTFEEIWKFSTYYSLGFLNHCMENLLLDQSFWLCPAEDNEEEESGIEVCISDGYLNLMYRGLLMQEGTFFVHCPDNVIREATVVDSELKVLENDSVVEGKETTVTLHSGPNDKTAHAKAPLEPVSPFHQWFLKTYSTQHLVDVPIEQQSAFSNQVAVGSSVAVVDCESSAPEELCFQSGDRIDIIGFYIECMQWFIGRHRETGKAGFVKISHVKPDMAENSLVNQEFLQEEKLFFKKESDYDCEKAKFLLRQLSETDLHTVYRLDTIEDNDAKAPQEEDSWKCLTNSKHSIKEENMKDVLQKLCLQHKHSKMAATQEQPNSRCSNRETELPSEEIGHPRFCISKEESSMKQGEFQSLLQFLNSNEYQPCFRYLYDCQCLFLKNTFHGFTDEREVVTHLGLVREAAKKSNMHWALTRTCFLLGRLCAKKQKFSQARVYFEEALGVIRGEFSDMFLVVAVYANLAAIYLKQKYKEKYLSIFDKVAALLMVIPQCVGTVETESVILKYALKKAVLSQDKNSEARACFLLVKVYTQLRQHEEALPFMERLQVLNNSLPSLDGTLSADCYFKLSNMYTRKCLPHVALSCVKAATQRSPTFMHYMKSVDYILLNSSKLYGLRKSGQIFPTQIAPYLRQALSVVKADEEKALSSIIYVSLAELYTWHKAHKRAIVYMRKAFNTKISGCPQEVSNILVALGWLYLLDGQNNTALDIFNSVMESVSMTSLQSGVIYNTSAIALRRANDIKNAARHYYNALHFSNDTGTTSNQAAVMANLGILCLHAHAYSLAEHYLVKSALLFCELHSTESSGGLIQVLLLLGHYYINGRVKEQGRLYYEWALLVAMEAHNLERQLQALQLLCQFYSTIATDVAQCIIYNKYQLSLVRQMSDKVFESEILETISHLYYSLGTERAYRSALEYTKRSLGIFIDLQQKDKEAFAWLQAGKIYHVLGQRELVDLYIQVAQEAALCTGDPNLGMELFECAGDIYANGSREREKALPLYRDRALPLAVKMGNEKAELKLCNKILELLLNLKIYEDSLDYAKASLTLSVALGRQLNERVAYHRMATIYHHLGQCELAEHYYLKAVSLCPALLEFDEEAVYYMKVYLILGDITFHDLKDPYDAAGYYHLALAAAMDVGNKRAQLKICTKLAVIYHNFLVDRDMSLLFYKKARVFAQALNVRRVNLSAEQGQQPSPFQTLM